MARLQIAVDALKNLASRNGRFFPGCVRIWKLFALEVRLMRVVINVEKIARHPEKMLGGKESSILSAHSLGLVDVRRLIVGREH